MLYGNSGASGGQGLEMAQISVLSKDANGAVKETSTIKVQFNPGSLKFSAGFDNTALQSASGNKTVDVKSPPATTMSVELLFDAVNNRRAAQDKKSGTRMTRSSGRGTMVFPEGHGDICENVNSFYGMMNDPGARFVDFKWGRMHFQGIVTSVSMDVTLFDRQAAPLRATVSLQIKGSQ